MRFVKIFLAIVGAFILLAPVASADQWAVGYDIPGWEGRFSCVGTGGGAICWDRDVTPGAPGHEHSCSKGSNGWDCSPSVSGAGAQTRSNIIAGALNSADSQGGPNSPTASLAQGGNGHAWSTSRGDGSASGQPSASPPHGRAAEGNCLANAAVSVEREPGRALTLRVNWGDGPGESNLVIPAGTGTWTVNLSHYYPGIGWSAGVGGGAGSPEDWHDDIYYMGVKVVEHGGTDVVQFTHRVVAPS